MLLIERLRRRRSKGSVPPRWRKYYAFLTGAWLYTGVWLVAIFWSSSGALGAWNWLAWVLLTITTPDLATLFCSPGRHAAELERQARPPERRWFTDVKSGDKQ